MRFSRGGSVQGDTAEIVSTVELIIARHVAENFIAVSTTAVAAAIVDVLSQNGLLSPMFRSRSSSSRGRFLRGCSYTAPYGHIHLQLFTGLL